MALDEKPGEATNKTILTISSRNYSSWSMRGWLLAKLSGIEFETVVVPIEEAGRRAELLLLSPSILVPCLHHDGIKVWDTLAIGEYLNELCPEAKLLPGDRKARAHCRAICGEMHSGFGALRSALPMNLRGHFPNFPVWSRARDDIERIGIFAVVRRDRERRRDPRGVGGKVHRLPHLRRLGLEPGRAQLAPEPLEHRPSDQRVDGRAFAAHAQFGGLEQRAVEQRPLRHRRAFAHPGNAHAPGIDRAGGHGLAERFFQG